MIPVRALAVAVTLSTVLVTAACSNGGGAPKTAASVPSTTVPPTSAGDSPFCATVAGLHQMGEGVTTKDAFFARLEQARPQFLKLTTLAPPELKHDVEVELNAVDKVLQTRDPAPFASDQIVRASVEHINTVCGIANGSLTPTPN